AVGGFFECNFKSGGRGDVGGGDGVAIAGPSPRVAEEEPELAFVNEGAAEVGGDHAGSRFGAAAGELSGLAVDLAGELLDFDSGAGALHDVVRGGDDGELAGDGVVNDRAAL